MKLIFVTGLPGCGKSHFARRLSNRINSVYINGELIRKELFMSPDYSKKEKKVLFHKTTELINRSFYNEENIIIDTILYTPHDYHFFVKNTSKHLNRTIVFEIISSEKLIQKRLMEERPDSDTNFTLYQLIRSYSKPLTVPHCRLWSDTANTKEMLNKAMAYLNTCHDIL